MTDTKGRVGMADTTKTPATSKVPVEDLQDSALHLLSPPNTVTFAEETPRPYFLRGQPKYSSTPLLLPLPAAKEELVATNLDAKLQALQEQGEGEASHDSGFDSLHSSLDPSLHSSLDCSAPRPTSPAPLRRALGALPKRRSPRNLSKSLAGIERLQGAKGSFVNFSEPTPAFPPSQKRALFKYQPREAAEGEEWCDVLRRLFEMDLRHVLARILAHCSPGDLCAVAQVSQLWLLALREGCKSQDQRRRSYLALRKRDQENHGSAVLLGRSGSPRRAMATLTNNRSPAGGKRAPAAAPVEVSPSKVRHRLFLEEARRLSPGERLQHCPLCTAPSRVAGARAECSAPKCAFLFCPDCLCEEHQGRGCRVTRTGSKVPRSGAVTSKKSKARLRRL